MVLYVVPIFVVKCTSNRKLQYNGCELKEYWIISEYLNGSILYVCHQRQWHMLSVFSVVNIDASATVGMRLCWTHFIAQITDPFPFPTVQMIADIQSLRSSPKKSGRKAFFSLQWLARAALGDSGHGNRQMCLIISQSLDFCSFNRLRFAAWDVRQKRGHCRSLI